MAHLQSRIIARFHGRPFCVLPLAPLNSDVAHVLSPIVEPNRAEPECVAPNGAYTEPHGFLIASTRFLHICVLSYLLQTGLLEGQ